MHILGNAKVEIEGTCFFAKLQIVQKIQFSYLVSCRAMRDREGAVRQYNVFLPYYSSK